MVVTKPTTPKKSKNYKQETTEAAADKETEENNPVVFYSCKQQLANKFFQR